MKGFIYLIEIVVVAIIMTIALSTFFSIRIKQDWQEAEIVNVGNNILNSLRNDNASLYEILSEDFSSINSSMPPNVKYGLRISGSPKSKILVGCANSCDYVMSLLTQSPSYGSMFVNGRWINFSVIPFDINNGIQPYDVIILVNYTNYSNPTINASINNYIRNGGVVIGLNDTITNTNADFNRLYNLTAVSRTNYTINFTSYNLSSDDTIRYFLGMGTEADANWWYIWEQQWSVTYYGGNRINLTNVSTPSINRTSLAEGSTFNLVGPDSKTYTFKIKKMWYQQRTDIQILNKTFAFKDFSEYNVDGNIIVGNATPSNRYSALARNNSAIWMSYFPRSSEYNSLLKAVILSRLDDWTAKYSFAARERATLSSFMPLCCDMPEMAELYLTLWYEV